MEAIKVVLPQDQETEISACRESNWEMRCAYARSYESRTAGEKGQDSLAVQGDEDCISFVLCDGVSMSFMGDLAAALLCKELLTWLPGLKAVAYTSEELTETFTAFLTDLTRTGTAGVRDYELPSSLAPMVQSVLEQKRMLGSESTFVCGRLNFQADQILLGWLGDSRLRIWKNHIEQTQQAFGPTFCTKERWSSRRGCIGQVHTWQSTLSGITRLVAYSDGLAILDGKMESIYSTQAIRQIIQKVDDLPNSDDISYFELILNNKGKDE